MFLMLVFKKERKSEMKKLKDPNRLRFKDYLGTTAMNSTFSVAEALMTSWFMVYLTDYAGIGKWGAILGSALLLFARLFDAVNDPLEGWIMDRAKVGKHGKYKPFIFLSTIMMTVGVGALFFIPSGISDSPVLICIWVIVSYLLFDIGYSFYAPNLVYRTMTLDQNARGKLIIGPRIVSMMVGMITGGLVGIVQSVNANFNDMHTSFGVTVLMLVGIMAVITIVGIALIKEKYHATKENDEQVKITDIFKVLKHNKALSSMTLSLVFSGFIWTFLFATMLYYVKWAFCADLATGAVDAATYGSLSLIGSMMMFMPLILGTILATPLMKLAKSAMRLHRILVLVEGLVGGILFVLHILGILPTSPVIFFALLAISATCIGIDYIPQETIYLECMDYELYVGGKDRSALCNACQKFVNKTQAAFASGIVGIILAAIGYNVDSATDTYLGELSALPNLLTWFIVIMGLIPCILGVIAYVILKKYPITDEIRAKMKDLVSK